jgi:hypothetical protein
MSGPKGLGAESMARPNGVGGWVRVRTHRGFGLGPYVFGPKGVWVWILPTPNPIWVGLGCRSRPKGVWVLPCPDPKWVRVGSESGSKRARGWVHVRTQMSLGPSLSEPKGVWVGFGVRTQVGWVWA